MTFYGALIILTYFEKKRKTKLSNFEDLFLKQPYLYAR